MVHACLGGESEHISTVNNEQVGFKRFGRPTECIAYCTLECIALRLGSWSIPSVRLRLLYGVSASLLLWQRLGDPARRYEER